MLSDNVPQTETVCKERQSIFSLQVKNRNA